MCDDLMMIKWFCDEYICIFVKNSSFWACVLEGWSGWRGEGWSLGWRAKFELLSMCAWVRFTQKYSVFVMSGKKNSIEDYILVLVLVEKNWIPLTSGFTIIAETLSFFLEFWGFFQNVQFLNLHYLQKRHHVLWLLKSTLIFTPWLTASFANNSLMVLVMKCDWCYNFIVNKGSKGPGHTLCYKFEPNLRRERGELGNKAITLKAHHTKER